jgi:CubicO group peptidase (beta-lactamase class C family)
LRTFISGSAAAIVLSLASQAISQSAELTEAARTRIDREANAVLAATGAPSASIAIVKDGAIAYLKAYGNARIEPALPAAPEMRYAIGSVSKQFTAAAVLALAEDGKLSLDDKVSKWYPNLTRADEITLRHLLSMTSGYQDYWPQDYVPPEMQQPTTADAIMQKWAGKPLDFEPGTKWQYSNTNYVIAGAIVQRVSGMPFMEFLQKRIFEKLGMKSVVDFDSAPLPATDAGPYLRNALGPLRLAPKEGNGWLFGAGQLAMTSHDLALWNIAMIDRTVLKSESYKSKLTDTILEAGTSTGYGLGVRVGTVGGKRRISHGGAVSGYTTINHVYPDDRAAIVVFTNIYPGAAGAPGQIADRISKILFDQVEETDSNALKSAKLIYNGLTKGIIDRSLFTDSANAYFSEQALGDYSASLRTLGTPKEFVATGQSNRGGMTIRSYRIRAGNVTMDLTMMVWPDGKIEQYIVSRSN